MLGCKIWLHGLASAEGHLKNALPLSPVLCVKKSLCLLYIRRMTVLSVGIEFRWWGRPRQVRYLRLLASQTPNDRTPVWAGPGPEEAGPGCVAETQICRRKRSPCGARWRRPGSRREGGRARLAGRPWGDPAEGSGAGCQVPLSESTRMSLVYTGAAAASSVRRFRARPSIRG